MVAIWLAQGSALDTAHFWTIGGISLLGTAANYLLSEAIVHGRAGPSQALCESQSLWMLALEVAVLHKVPNEWQVIGFVLGLTGGLFIVCADQPSQRKDI